MSIAMFGELHIDLAVLKLQKMFVKVAGGQENWFNQVFTHLGKQPRFRKITHHHNKTNPLGDSWCLVPLPLNNTHQEHVKSTHSNIEPPSPRAWQTGA